MKIKSIVLSLFLAATLASSTFAAEAIKPTTDVATMITKEFSKFNIDYSKIENKTLKIRFMINEKSEIIVLSTDSKELDQSIKSALNYDKIDKEDLVPFKVYIVPVTFE